MTVSNIPTAPGELKANFFQVDLEMGVLLTIPEGLMTLLIRSLEADSLNYRYDVGIGHTTFILYGYRKKGPALGLKQPLEMLLSRKHQ